MKARSLFDRAFLILNMNKVRGFARDEDENETQEPSKNFDEYLPLIELIKDIYFFGQSKTEPFTTADFIDFAHMNGFEVSVSKMNSILHHIGYMSETIPNSADRLWAVHLVL